MSELCKQAQDFAWTEQILLGSRVTNYIGVSLDPYSKATTEVIVDSAYTAIRKINRCAQCGVQELVSSDGKVLR